MQSQLDIDDALIAQFLGSKYLGRRYLRYSELEALGLVDNRGSLKLWMDAGTFPRAIKISGPFGKTLVWLAAEVAQLIAQRIRERDDSYAEIETGTPVGGARSDFNHDPSQAGHINERHRRCLIPPPTT